MFSPDFNKKEEEKDFEKKFVMVLPSEGRGDDSFKI